VGDRVVPDGIYTNGFDTEVEAITIDSQEYIQLIELKGAQLNPIANWGSAVGNTLTVIFKPPNAETIITANPASILLQNFDAVFELVTDGNTRTIKFNRVTTAPQVIKN
jgi:hypothetical protein